MKTLILNGSPRKSGVTAQILGHFSDLLQTRSEIENIYLYAEEIKPCRGCLKCRPDKTCILPHDAAHDIAFKINESDLLIFGFPTYWGNMPGPLKNLFDRCVPVFEYIEGFQIKKMQKGKKAIIVTSSSAPFPYNQLPSQSRGAIRSIKTILNAGGIETIRVVNIANSKNFDQKRASVFEKINHFINWKF
ncbi:MAG: flavodoxin family protein [Candidatus Marinimicrobia bacterium]|nr:flavodoxin family protein [Candidatus Neomarinimicrobiota bacterium]